jgi:AAA15 family ATPase/GTPase
MLIRLKIANFLSFKDEVTFSMIASRERQHSHRVFSDEASGLKLLPTAAIFGGNGAGKSNFYFAIEFLRKLVLRPSIAPDDRIPVEPYKLDDGASEGQPTRFVIEVLPNLVPYRFTVGMVSSRITEEVLEEIRGDKSLVIYSRRHNAAEDGISWEVKPLQKRANAAADRDFIGFKTRDTLPNQLFLSNLGGKNVPVADEVIGWFREQLALMLPTTTFKLLEFSLPSQRDLQEYCNTALRNAGTGVFEIGQKRISWDVFEAPQSLKDQLMKRLDEGQMTFILNPDGRRYSITRKNGELQVANLFTLHTTESGGKVRFELSEESQGTQRFVDLLPAFHELTCSNRPKVFIIDELDRSLHTRLTRHLIENFLKTSGADSRSQLIFTTHDALLLDQCLLRRDEIWFIEKTKTGASCINSLSAFDGVRNDRDILKSYLVGEFGGIPSIK